MNAPDENPVLTLPLCATKAQAVRAAFAAIGRTDVPAARALLARQGLYVDASYCYALVRDDTMMAAAGGGR